MAPRTQNLVLRFQGTWSILLHVIDVARYTFTYPWRDSYFSMSQALEDPDRYLDQWIKVRQSEYSSIGLVSSVVSAVVAQMLQLQQLQESPWPASAAVYLSLLLSLMALVTALHHTIHLNSVSFQPSPNAKLWRIFAPQIPIDKPLTRDNALRSPPRLWLRALLFNIPQVLLSYSIICTFVAVSLMAIHPLWDQTNSAWGRPQKIACASIAGLVLGIVAYFGGVVCQYAEERAASSELN